MDDAATREATRDERLSETAYLALWKLEQDHSAKRWTIVTFFLGLSFGILGFSFQSEKARVLMFIQHLAAISSYWFAYVLFVRLNDFTRFLREYLTGCENAGATPLLMQTRAREYMRAQNRFSTTNLLLYYGLVYTIAILASWLLM